MAVEVAFTSTENVFDILTEDKARVQFWTMGAHNPLGVNLEPRKIDYTDPTHYEFAF